MHLGDALNMFENIENPKNDFTGAVKTLPRYVSLTPPALREIEKLLNNRQGTGGDDAASDERGSTTGDGEFF